MPLAHQLPEPHPTGSEHLAANVTVDLSENGTMSSKFDGLNIS
jgi:hypothetical protein